MGDIAWIFPYLKDKMIWIIPSCSIYMSIALTKGGLMRLPSTLYQACPRITIDP